MQTGTTARGRRRGARRALAGLLTAATVAAGALLLLVGVGPRVADYRTMTMLTGSMAPTCPAGAVVVARPQPTETLRGGEVLTYQIPVDDHRVVSHRIVDLTREGDAVVVQTKGDANNGVDPWSARIEDDSVWTVRGCIPHLGSALLALRQPAVLPVVSWGLPGLLLGWLLTGIWFPRTDDG